jgi:peptidoglycan/LPS O-acetylase OafA/YrhL
VDITTTGMSWAASRPLALLGVTTVAMFNQLTSAVVLPTCGAYAFFCFGFTQLDTIRWRKSWPDVSYGVYLYGWPCEMLLAWYFPGIAPWQIALSCVPLTLFCGTLSWYIIEKPFMQFRPRKSQLRVA